MMTVSPKPWVNGDTLVESSTLIEGDNWNGYSLIFELMAPLRDMMMYRPYDLDEDTWAKYTRALTDCNAKTTDYVERGGAQYSTSQIYDIMNNPNYKDIHHYILQYLEEGSIDLVCLSTELEMDHCDVTREASGGALGKRCNCWFDAYEAIYGICPVVDMEFEHCDLTVAPTVCTEVFEVVEEEVVEEGGEEGTDDDLPNPPDVEPTPPSGMPDRGRRRR